MPTVDKHIVAIQNYIAGVDHAGLQFNTPYSHFWISYK
jgi:hypothetical protein